MRNSVSEGLQLGLFDIKKIPHTKFKYCSIKVQWGFKHTVTCKYLLRHWEFSIELGKFDIKNHHKHFHTIKIDIFF